jgi:hypothetical protein
MMAHADVFLTVYSTMVVSRPSMTADRERVSIAPRLGYTCKLYLRKYSLPLSRVGLPPTAGSAIGRGKVVYNGE